MKLLISLGCAIGFFIVIGIVIAITNWLNDFTDRHPNIGTFLIIFITISVFTGVFYLCLYC